MCGDGVDCGVERVVSTPALFSVDGYREPDRDESCGKSHSYSWRLAYPRTARVEIVGLDQSAAPRGVTRRAYGASGVDVGAGVVVAGV